MGGKIMTEHSRKSKSGRWWQDEVFAYFTLVLVTEWLGPRLFGLSKPSISDDIIGSTLFVLWAIRDLGKHIAQAQQ
jgi:hypothetical protein